MRWLSTFFLLLLILSGCASEEKKRTTLTRFVTEDAILALEIKNLSVLKDSLINNDFLERLSNFPAYQKIKKPLAFLDFVQQETPGLLIFSKTEQDSLAILYATTYALDFFSSDSLGPKTAEIIPTENDAITKYNFGDSQLFTRVIGNEIVLSTSLDVLLKNGDSPETVVSNPIFEKLFQTSDKTKPATLYVNPKSKDSLVNTLLNNMLGLDSAALTDWTAFDILGGTNKLALNGVSTINDSLPSNLSLFKHTVPLPNITASFAPIETNALLSYSFKNYAVFAQNRQDYLGIATPADSLFKTVEEIGFIHLNEEKAILLNTYGPENIADFLVGIRKKATDYQGNIILELSNTDFLNTSFQPLVKNFKANYSTVLEDAFIFSETKGILQTIISDYKKGNTYHKNPKYITATKTAAEAATMFLIADGQHLKKLSPIELNNASNLSNAKISDYTIVSQMVADGTLFHSNVSAQRKGSEVATPVANTSLKFELEQPLASSPQFVSNHLTKKKEIVVQDINNNLYLFSAEGKILWKKQLKSKIQGAIQQVDIFKNGRLQLAFTTQNEFLVLDRNGKNVALFDKHYEGASLNPLAVFDYDKKREYRFVVTQKEKVFMYDRKGKVVSGFKYTKASAPIREAPKHMVIGKKDYITFLLEDGTFRALNRKGEPRVTGKEKIDFSNNGLRMHRNAFTITDKNGKLCQIDVHGNVKRIGLGLNDYHTMDANSNYLVYMNDNILSVNGTKTTLELGAYTRPTLIEMGIKTYISVTDLQNQKVYVFDEKSNLLPNFPLFGNSEIDLADIDGDSKLELVTTNTENSLVVYQLN